VPGEAAPVRDKVFHDEVSVRRLVGRLSGLGRLWVVYEAGPTGYELCRLLRSLGVGVTVAAPALVPRGRGDRVKTDRRDADLLAVQLRAGALSPVAVPSRDQEALRDLSRALDQAVGDRSRARNRVNSFLLRHGRVFRTATNWTLAHRRWLAAQSFDQPAAQVTLAHYLAVEADADRRVEVIAGEFTAGWEHQGWAGSAARLAAYRGISPTTSSAIEAEIFDWRRFPHPRPLMAYTGLCASEYSSGQRQSRGSITKAGNAYLRNLLVDAAGAYRQGPHVGATKARLHTQLDAATVTRARAVETRLCRRWRHLTGRGKHHNVVKVAIARELVGHLWAEATSPR
jgi:transposase